MEITPHPSRGGSSALSLRATNAQQCFDRRVFLPFRAVASERGNHRDKPGGGVQSSPKLRAEREPLSLLQFLRDKSPNGSQRHLIRQALRDLRSMRVGWRSQEVSGKCQRFTQQQLPQQDGRDRREHQAGSEMAGGDEEVVGVGDSAEVGQAVGRTGT